MRSVRKGPTAHQHHTPVQVPLPLDDGTVSLAMIQALIPLGLRAVEEALQQEVTAPPCDSHEASCDVVERERSGSRSP